MQPFYLLDVGTLHQCLQREYAGVLASRAQVDNNQAEALERVVEDLVFLSFFVRPTRNTGGNNSCTRHVALISAYTCVCVCVCERERERERERKHPCCYYIYMGVYLKLLMSHINSYHKSSLVCQPQRR
jgi:hypothetical protein